ncbi:MAG: DUF4101 domain-containing protein [Synechococcales cyanobacterium RU_4_20]|nr:DUF4101 domain-containing protein [Synechococcales cyanobacterium RU_4_20]NJR68075.1 DUF4101 domain-containing protein [Synechococcales cyanobacterium CRU_2_2]
MGDRPQTYGASPAASATSRRQRRRPERAGRSSLKLGRILLLAGGTLLTLLLLFALLSRVFAWVGSWGKQDANNAAKTTQVTKLEKDQLAISLNEPVLSNFAAVGSVSKVSATGTLDKAKAQQVIELWLGTKVDVFGKDYKLDLLPNVLTGEALTTWQGEGELSKGDGITVQYEHKLAIDDVQAGESPDKAAVLATVTEIAKYYQNGEVISVRDDRDLQLRYNLLQEDGSWKISSMGVR